MGPIACAKHLKDFLPTHQHLKDLNSSKRDGFCFSCSMGKCKYFSYILDVHKNDGIKRLKSASRISILNANYISKNYQKNIRFYIQEKMVT